ncbi:uncharacterized protein LOC131158617 [Malania oleifera]|uniref:uncharacterized protein LOC131158617 n=1 Tax=Malania oleifera TaxID=397392 RepID=UPI0025ADE8C3|nr:uncharacterized protein LOC131158617 [Malania oleifera]
MTILAILVTNLPPRWFDLNTHCAYHANSSGHSIDQCWAFKCKVQSLKDAGWLAFDDKPTGIQGNLLPNHEGDEIGMVGVELKKAQEANLDSLALDWVYQELRKEGLIESEATRPKGARCECQSSLRKTVQGCKTFKMILCKMLDDKSIEVGSIQKDGEVLTLGDKEQEHPPCPHQPFIPLAKKSSYVHKTPTCLVISVPRPFRYQNDKAVPWKYNCQARGMEDTGNIAGVTRNDRVYAPAQSGKLDTKQIDESSRSTKRPVQPQEVEEFLKFIKHSEYSVVDQLKNMPAHISILSLLLNLEVHREALLKLLNQAYIPQDISVEKFSHVIGGLSATNYITFSDEEISLEGRGHNQALHISVKCKDHMIARVLVDNGSSLNVFPMTTLQKLPVDPSYVKQNNLAVRAFDETRKESVGAIEIPILIEPVIFNVTFQVMDITPSYNCLLGRPWIHNTGAVASSLHQRLKFVVGNQLVYVYGETNVMITKPTSTSYVEAAEEALEDSFRAFEIINVTTIAEGSPIPCPQISAAVHMMASEMIRHGYHLEKGLKKYLQGIRKPLMLKEVKDRYSLGYIPTAADRRKKAEEKKMRRVERITNETSSKEGLYVPSISQTFVKNSQSNLEAKLRQLSISVLDAEVPSSTSAKWIRHLQPGVQLQN